MLRDVARHYADRALAKIATAPSPFSNLDAVEIRASIAARAATRKPGPEVHEVREVRLGECGARLYRPTAENAPIVLYLHGGGWTVGDLDSFDRVCRRLALSSKAAVLALDYRLAPEDPWPASVEDTVAALRWIAGAPAELDGLGPAVGVAGDSAGGTLAALACQRLRDEDPGSLPALQVLIYANADLTGAQPSMRENATGGGLEPEAVRWFNGQWVPDPARWGDSGVSPLALADLAGLPPALVISAEHDPLRDELELYAERLGETGVEVVLRREAGQIHNFMQYDEISPAAAAAADRIGAEIGSRLGTAG